MAARKTPAPAQGEAYVLENAEGHGAGRGHIPTGSVVKVIDVHPAGTPGVGHAGTDVVLAALTHETHLINDDRTHAPGTAVRTFSLPVADFQRLFKKADA
ncbi:hypothetical protein PV336_15830 [Streptomyces sp. MI02-2A]|uniref:hypothetical protein n=1 Tax=Streptomyces sp. MI02-2A TaxID=3028688 RepID=UPI0029B61FCE|nr:hypothetical protein [Streptomyces sp. MI02-2A]MDX3260689.1 hypothetical protein [Streptomyces sp. MI02-2A]